jgi:hypothetical protein
MFFGSNGGARWPVNFRAAVVKAFGSNGAGRRPVNFRAAVVRRSAVNVGAARVLVFAGAGRDANVGVPPDARISSGISVGTLLVRVVRRIV